MKRRKEAKEQTSEKEGEKVVRAAQGRVKILFNQPPDWKEN